MKNNRISTTITTGRGSERHNHDKEYRAGLEHVEGDKIIELVPYKSYREKINELLAPSIQNYNERLAATYTQKMKDYEEGKLKSRPKKARYQPIDFDYYKELKNRTRYNEKTGKKEEIKIFRSLILGLGDQDDRQTGKISEDQAVKIFQNVIKDWPEMFPNFKLLGATVHLDESGFYHCHVDYFPLSEKTKPGKGLNVSLSEDEALKAMGYKPERSIINGRDKAPILFNSFRNNLYLKVEKELNREGLRLSYGVSEKKHPGKDSGKNVKLSEWQKTQDNARDIQELKNQFIDGLEEGITPDNLEKNFRILNSFSKRFKEINDEYSSRKIKGSNISIPYPVFSQFYSFINSLTEIFGQFRGEIQKVKSDYYSKSQDYRDEIERNRWKDKELKLIKEENAELATENNIKTAFINSKKIEPDFQEFKKEYIKKKNREKQTDRGLEIEITR